MRYFSPMKNKSFYRKKYIPMLLCHCVALVKKKSQESVKRIECGKGTSWPFTRVIRMRKAILITLLRGQEVRHRKLLSTLQLSVPLVTLVGIARANHGPLCLTRIIDSFSVKDLLRYFLPTCFLFFTSV